MSCQPNGGTLQLGCPAFPNTSPTAQPQWDYFAWNSFIAANWPALDPVDEQRATGLPGPPAELRERGQRLAARLGDLQGEARSLLLSGRPHQPRDPGPWNQAPHYGPVPTRRPCAPTARTTPPSTAAGSSGRAARWSSTAWTRPSRSLSEALETPAALCRGFTTSPCSADGKGHPTAAASKARPVAPRVWKGARRAEPQPVVYEVKVNYDFYNTSSTIYYLDTAKTRRPANGLSSSPSGPARAASHRRPQPQRRCSDYDAQACIATLPAGQDQHRT